MDTEMDAVDEKSEFVLPKNTENGLNSSKIGSLKNSKTTKLRGKLSTNWKNSCPPANSCASPNKCAPKHAASLYSVNQLYEREISGNPSRCADVFASSRADALYQRDLKAHTGCVNALDFSPTEEWFVSGMCFFFTRIEENFHDFLFLWK